MSRKSKALAASLAALVNGNTISKGIGTTITPADMLPLATILARLDRDARRAERVEKLLRRNGKLIDALAAPDPTQPVLPSVPDGDDLLARIDEALAKETAHHVASITQ